MLDIGARKDMPHFFWNLVVLIDSTLLRVSAGYPSEKNITSKKTPVATPLAISLYALYVLNHQKSPLIMYFLFNWHFAWVCGFGFGASWLLFHVVPGFNTSMVELVHWFPLLTGYISWSHQFKMNQWQQSYPMDQ